MLDGTYSNDEPIFYKQILTNVSLRFLFQFFFSLKFQFVSFLLKYLVDHLKINEYSILKNDAKLVDCLLSLIENGKQILYEAKKFNHCIAYE